MYSFGRYFIQVHGYVKKNHVVRFELTIEIALFCLFNKHLVSAQRPYSKTQGHTAWSILLGSMLCVPRLGEIWRQLGYSHGRAHERHLMKKRQGEPGPHTLLGRTGDCLGEEAMCEWRCGGEEGTWRRKFQKLPETSRKRIQQAEGYGGERAQIKHLSCVDVGDSWEMPIPPQWAYRHTGCSKTGLNLLFKDVWTPVACDFKMAAAWGGSVTGTGDPGGLPCGP